MLVKKLETLLRTEKIAKDLHKTEEEMQKIVKLSECLGARELLNIRYTNKLSYLQSQLEPNNHLVSMIGFEISRVLRLLQAETNLEAQNLREMEQKVSLMFSF